MARRSFKKPRALLHFLYRTLWEWNDNYAKDAQAFSTALSQDADLSDLFCGARVPCSGAPIIAGAPSSAGLGGARHGPANDGSRAGLGQAPDALHDPCPGASAVHNPVKTCPTKTRQLFSIRMVS